MERSKPFKKDIPLIEKYLGRRRFTKFKMIVYRDIRLYSIKNRFIAILTPTGYKDNKLMNLLTKRFQFKKVEEIGKNKIYLLGE